MKKKSDVLLLIPHYNNFEGLLRSLKSIKEDQVIDVLIVDDGSIKDTIKEDKLDINELSDLNLLFIYLDSNQGIEHALNKGIDYFKANEEYEFLARLDCGDLCGKNRFLIQKELLISNPKLGIVGSNIKFVDLEGNFVYYLNLPEADKDIRKGMFKNAMFIHPSIMIKRIIFNKVKYYPTTYPAAEDYAFFFEILKYFEGANINQYLVTCELNPDGISIKKRKVQLRSRLQLIKENFYFGFYPIYGFTRNILLYMLPFKFVACLKRLRNNANS